VELVAKETRNRAFAIPRGSAICFTSLINPMKNQLLALAAATLIPFAASSAQVEATSAPFSGPSNVISLQPLNAVILTMYSAEYERRTSRSLSFGVGATYWDLGEDSSELTYTSGDLKLRFYPQGNALHGFSFGGSVGFTSVSAMSFDGTSEESASGASFGILIEHQWLMGVSRNFAVALGVGAKAVMVDEDEISSDDFIARYPTIRISVGYAF
jgi:hypothetical protein